MAVSVLYLVFTTRDWSISPSRMANRGLNAARMWSVMTRNSMANNLGGTLMAVRLQIVILHLRAVQLFGTAKIW